MFPLLFFLFFLLLGSIIRPKLEGLKSWQYFWLVAMVGIISTAAVTAFNATIALLVSILGIQDFFYGPLALYAEWLFMYGAVGRLLYYFVFIAFTQWYKIFMLKEKRNALLDGYSLFLVLSFFSIPAARFALLAEHIYLIPVMIMLLLTSVSLNFLPQSEVKEDEKQKKSARTNLDDASYKRLAEESAGSDEASYESEEEQDYRTMNN